jgi:hypothetical protein
LFTYYWGMRAVLALQLPTEDWRRGRILVASTDPGLIRWFCRTVLAHRRERLDHLKDPFDRELARLEVEQLEARLSFALVAGEVGDRRDA